MAEISNAFKVKKGLDVVGDSALHGNALVDGYITTPTLVSTENSTKVATTAFVKTAIANLIANSPATLDTLNEIAAALGDDPNFATTMTNNLALKAPLANPALTGVPTAPTAAATTNTTQIATTAYVKSQLYATLASPTFTGTVIAPTPTTGDNSTKVATTAFVQTTLAAVGFGADAAPVPGTTTASIDTATIVSGMYYVTANNTGTKPFSDTTGFLLVSRATTGTYVHQLWFDDVSARTFSRSYSSSAWTSWREAAYLDSPTFTGTPAAPTAAVDTSTTQLATTAFVTGQAGSANPTMNGTVAVGTSTRFARQDHVHPTDSTRAPLANPALTGTPTAPTAAPGTNSTQIATTAYADAIAALKANIANPSFTGTETHAGSASFAGSLGSADYVSFPFVNGGSYVTSNSATVITGALKINLPIAYVSSVQSFDVDVFEFATDSALRIRISGGTFSSTSTWGNATAIVLGGVAARLPNIRFGNDGSSACIWIGELTDTWKAPSVNISNLHVGYTGITSVWQNPWVISFATTFDTVKIGPIVPNDTAYNNSPAFTGTPTVPTPATGDNSSQIPNTSWVNSAIAASGSTSIATVPITSTAMTLTAAQFSNSMILFTGALTGNTVITVPATAHAFIAANNTTGSYTLSIQAAGKTPSVSVVQNKANSLYGDTTGVYATSSTTGVQFAKQFIMSASTTLDLSYLGSIVFVSGTSTTITMPLANSYPAGAGVHFVNNGTASVTIVASGSDAGNNLSFPITLKVNDCLFLESNGSSIWWSVIYSNVNTPSFKTSVTAPRLVAGNVTDDGSTSVQGSSGAFTGQLKATAASYALLATNGTGAGQTSIGLNRVGGATDQKNFEIIQDSSGNFGIRSINDAYNSSAYALNVTRGSGYTLSKMALMQNGGRVVVGTSTDNNTDMLQVNGTVQTAGGVVFPDGSKQVTANGVTAPISTVVTPAANASSIATAGYSVNLVQVFKNNGRLIPTVDFTATDGVNIVLTTPATGRDRYEILTQVIYSPSTVFQPVSRLLALTNGQTTITPVGGYPIGCAWLFQNNEKLVVGQDYTASDGVNIVLTTAANGTDQFELVTFQPFAANGMLPLTGGAMTGSLTVGTGAVDNLLTLDSAAGYRRYLNMTTGGSYRWVLGTNGTAESGSNAGSDFLVARYSDTGAFIDYPLTITRATGNTVVQNTLSCLNGTLYSYGYGGDVNKGLINLNQAGNRFLYYDGTQYQLPNAGLFVNGSLVPTVGQANVFTNVNTFNANTWLSSTATTSPYFYLKAGSYQPFIRSNNTIPGIEFVNSANNAVNMTVQDSGVVQALQQFYVSSSANVIRYKAIGYGIGQGYGMWFQAGVSAASNTASAISFYNYQGAGCGSITHTDSSVSYNTTSDYRLKENVVPLTGALDRVMKAKPSRFNFISEPGRTVDGVIAHEIAEVVPEAVTGEKDAVDENGDMVIQQVDYAKLVPLLLASIQELKTELDTVKAELATIKGA